MTDLPPGSNPEQVPTVNQTLRRTPQGLVRPVRWRRGRYWLFGVACLATLIAVFYAEENWRGRRIWNKCRRELEAKGEVLDWAAFIPKAVPDDQNVFKAPKMQEWFVKPSLTDIATANRSNELSQALSRTLPSEPKASLLVELRTIPSGAVTGAEQTGVLRLGDPRARNQTEKAIHELLGPVAAGALGYNFVARSLEEIKPVSFAVPSDATPSLSQIAALFPTNLFSSSLGQLRFEFAGSNSFRVLVWPALTPAAGYLAASDQCAPQFQLIRNALARPYARMEGDYQQPFARPIPNFVVVRTLAQILTQRAQCHLLLGQPGAALQDLTLFHGLFRFQEAETGGTQPTTLVATMINVALTGLYVDTIAYGFRLEAWREPQLAALQQQLAQINLLPSFAAAFKCERAGICRTFESVSPSRLGVLFLGPQRSFWEKISNPRAWFYRLTPRGWLYQNMAAVAIAEQEFTDCVDATNKLILASRVDRLAGELAAKFSRSSPFTFMAAAAMPNYLKAAQVLARNQTRANQAFIVCALERYRVAHGQYPETLEALVPQLTDTLPHNLIGGNPLKYNRTSDGKFVLSSIGWVGKQADDNWVWQY